MLIGQIVGALSITFLLSRLALWLLRSMSGWPRFVLAHGTCLALAIMLGGFGFANGGPWAPAAVQAAAIYTLPQAFWLCVDLFRRRRSAF